MSGLTCESMLTCSNEWKTQTEWSNSSLYTGKWMGKPSMIPSPTERRGPRREVVAGAMNPMAMWTKDIAFLSATSHMMWNGRPSKTWWKKKVRCLDKGLTQSALDMTKVQHPGSFCLTPAAFKGFWEFVQGLIVYNGAWDLVWELYGSKGLEEVPLICLVI